MAKTAELKIPADIEFRVIGNAFGLLISSAGLLAGSMVRERSFDYWLDDIVPLAIVLWLLFRFFRNLLSTVTVYRDAPPLIQRARSAAAAATAISPEQVVMGQIPARTVPTPEQVVEEVARRIDAKKADAEKKNRFTN